MGFIFFRYISGLEIPLKSVADTLFVEKDNREREKRRKEKASNEITKKSTPNPNLYRVGATYWS